jgi:hypothetical protein
MKFLKGKRKSIKRAAKIAQKKGKMNVEISNEIKAGALSKMELIEIIAPYWEFIVSLLTFIKLFTREKVDLVIDEIVNVGELIFNGSGDEIKTEEVEKFLQAFAQYWGTISTILEMIEFFTPKKVDDVIDEIQLLGDAISENIEKKLEN